MAGGGEYLQRCAAHTWEELGWPFPPGQLVVAEQCENLPNVSREAVSAVFVPSRFVITTSEFTFRMLVKDDVE